MKYGHKIASGFLILAGLSAIYYCLYIGRNTNNVALLSMPSYAVPIRLDPYYLIEGLASLFGIMSCLFAWIQLEEMVHGARTIYDLDPHEDIQNVGVLEDRTTTVEMEGDELTETIYSEGIKEGYANGGMGDERQ